MVEEKDESKAKQLFQDYMKKKQAPLMNLGQSFKTKEEILGLSCVNKKDQTEKDKQEKKMK